MRPTRLLYVENDSALRRILGEMLGQSKELEIIGSFAKSENVLDRSLVRKADVALIDFSLDQNGLNGVELGIALRNINDTHRYCHLFAVLCCSNGEPRSKGYPKRLVFL